MKARLLLCTVIGSLFTAGCATQTTASGGREKNVLGGAVTVETNSFQPPTAATINTDTSKIVGRGNPSGKKVSLLWGLLTFTDY
ncbi:MAG: hypothetical protein Q7S40_22065 [Opitutaceae bacterium]|nr:hypothetical protein [Opitutaceae bacterium]